MSTTHESKFKSPLLRYFGGKWRLSRWIIAAFPPHTVYVEPYGGGASVLLRKDRVHTEIYNDLNQEIFNLFDVLRNDKDKLKEQIELTPFSRDEFVRAYQITNDSIEQARRTLVRSAMGFASQATSGQRSGFRSALRTNYKLPAHRWSSMSVLIDQVSNRMSGVVLENKEALEVMKQHDGPETLFYVDPPYVSETRSTNYKNVYKHEMSAEQHVEMLECLNGLEGAVVLSGYRNKLYEEHLKNWKSHDCITQADGKQTGEMTRQETIWIKPAKMQIQDVHNLFINVPPQFINGRFTTGKAAHKTTGKRLGKTSMFLLQLLKLQPKLNIQAMAAKMDLTEDGVNYQLRLLTQNGRLVRIGGRKMGRWKVL